MDYTTLGRTGLKVSVMGVGGGGPSRLGTREGAEGSPAVRIIREAFDAGVNFIDTAESYGTEEVVGQAIKELDRDQVVISTKLSSGRHLNKTEVSKRLEASLQRLGTHYIDIYNLHALVEEEYDYHLNEVVPVLEDLRDQGKIRFIGVTERFIPDPGHRMLQRALEDNVWDVMMVGFNLLNQSARELVFPHTVRKDIGVQIMFAVRKALSRPVRLLEVMADLIEKGQVDPDEIDIRDPLGFVTGENGAESIPDAAYRFCRDEPGTHVILSGTGNPEHVRGNIESFHRPSLPDELSSKLRHIFRKVDSVSGH
jgi:L-galactose dehydrogenase